MNFKFFSISLFALSFFFMGCGVKSDPIPPAGTGIPSYVNQFLNQDTKVAPEGQDEKEDESDSSNGKQSGKQ